MTGRPKGSKKVVEIPDEHKLLTPYETAMYFGVDAKTVNRWVKTGKLRATRTLGGHHRIYLTSVLEAVEAGKTKV